MINPYKMRVKRGLGVFTCKDKRETPLSPYFIGLASTQITAS